MIDPTIISIGTVIYLILLSLALMYVFSIPFRNKLSQEKPIMDKLDYLFFMAFDCFPTDPEAKEEALKTVAQTSAQLDHWIDNLFFDPCDSEEYFFRWMNLLTLYRQLAFSYDLFTNEELEIRAKEERDKLHTKQPKKLLP